MNAQIEELARHKDFAALSANERARVLAEMPEEEYYRLHQVLHAARMQYAQAEAPVHMRANLLKQMATHAHPPRQSRLLRYAAPLWRAAAFFILGMAAAMLMRKTTVVEKVITDVQYKVDTVYLEHVQWRDRVRWKTRVVYVEKTPAPPVALVPGKTEPPGVLPEFSSKELSKSAAGTSLGDTPELLQFFTQAEK